jgi:hypothetical protein
MAYPAGVRLPGGRASGSDLVGLGRKHHSWLHYHVTELLYQSASREDMTLMQAAWHQNKLTAHHTRYLRACESPARVRRLLPNVPAVQVNTATRCGRQMNVAQ